MEKGSPLQSKKQAFRKTDRILNSVEFDRVFKNTEQKLVSDHCMILASSNDKPGPRLGLVVAKKKIAQSKQRNNFKRAIKESFRKNKVKLKNLDIVVLAKKSSGKIIVSSISTEITMLFANLENKK